MEKGVQITNGKRNDAGEKALVESFISKCNEFYRLVGLIYIELEIKLFVIGEFSLGAQSAHRRFEQSKKFEEA